MTYTSNSDDLFLEVSNVFAKEKQLKKPKISPESSRKHSARETLFLAVKPRDVLTEISKIMHT